MNGEATSTEPLELLLDLNCRHPGYQQVMSGLLLATATDYLLEYDYRGIEDVLENLILAYVTLEEFLSRGVIAAPGSK